MLFVVISIKLIIPIFSVVEKDFLYLVNKNRLPKNVKQMLSVGFPRGFLSESFGMSVVAKGHKSDDPVLWYKELESSATLKTICDLAREEKFNCFLFNVMAREYILLLRFAKGSTKHLIPESKYFTANFIYQYCRMRYVRGLAASYDSYGYCPNPCFNKTNFCQSLANTIGGLCQVDFNYPYREDGFKCVCKDGYVWVNNAQLCVDSSSTIRPDALGCSVIGTQSVSETSDSKFFCVCKKNYYGKKCDKLLDACKHPVGNKFAGNGVCRITKGNLCISSGSFHPITEPFYHCLCTDDFSRNYSFTQDNCLYEYKPCEKLICINGFCVSTSSQKPAHCVCKNGWYGKNCEIPVPLNDISPWTQWSTCIPACGENRVRQRTRVCLRLFCGDDKYIDVRPCRSRSCYRYHHPDSRDKFIMGVQMSDDKRSETNYITYILIIVVIAHMILATIFVQWRLFRPFLAIVGSFQETLVSAKDSLAQNPNEEYKKSLKDTEKTL